MKRLIAQIFVTLILTFCHLSLAAEKVVLFGTFPNGYIVNVLKLALGYFPEKDYQVESYMGLLPKIRAFERLDKQQGIDVIYGGSTIDRETNNLPVRFPLLRGLNGWRVPLVHKENMQLFSNVNNLSDLKKLKPGLFHNWSDTRIMESNGITVVKASNYEALYNMLDKKRFDYFPRSILEVDADLQTHKQFEIAINPDILIYYPTAYYFYVQKGNDQLANDIETGLKRALADGSFLKLFNTHYGEIIKKYTDQSPRIIRLKTPLLSDKTPLSQKQFWEDLERIKQ